jgi:hypothetical protein
MEWRGVRLAKLICGGHGMGYEGASLSLYLCEFAGEARESQRASERGSARAKGEGGRKSQVSP